MVTHDYYNVVYETELGAAYVYGHGPSGVIKHFAQRQFHAAHADKSMSC